MPIFYMFWRFANFSKNLASFLSSWDVTTLLFNTLLLFFAVIFSSLLLGLLISILTVRYEFPGSKILFSFIFYFSYIAFFKNYIDEKNKIMKLNISIYENLMYKDQKVEKKNKKDSLSKENNNDKNKLY